MSAVVNNVIPVFAIIGLGFALARFGLLSDEFRRVSDRLAYFLLLPALIFWKIAQRGAGDLDRNMILAVLGAVLTGWLVSLLAARTIRLEPARLGAFSQCCYRFNTYIGLALCFSAFGDPGTARFGVIIGLAIPFINLLAVSTLIWASGQSFSGARKVWLVIRSIVSNPLILACLLGLVWAGLDRPLPLILDKTLSLLTVAALPLALISIGGGLNLKKLKGHLGPALTASLVKIGLMPLIGLAWLSLLRVGGLSLGVAMVFFALATSPSAYILSAQLHSDPDLAAAVIVLTTLLSILSLSLVLAVYAP